MNHMIEEERVSSPLLCAKCPSRATNIVELVVLGLRIEQELCDLHMRELLDGARDAEAS